jgi:hypothetical protein
MNITYTTIPWELVVLCATDGWEIELFNEKTQEVLIYKVGEHELDSDGYPAIVGKESKPHPPVSQPPMRKN